MIAIEIILSENKVVDWEIPSLITDSNLDLSYIAGLFDGEGCISIDKAENQGKDFPRFQLHTTIHIREGNYLKELYNVFGGSFTKDKNTNPKHSSTWRWRLSSKKAANFLILIYPYLRLKKKQAFWGIKFQSLFTKKGGYRSKEEAVIQQDYYTLLRDLNKRGVEKWKD